MDKKPKVLFLSTGNASRSEMAEGFLRSLAGEQFIAVSAGIESNAASPLAFEVMREAEVDITTQKAKSVKESFREHFGYVVTIFDSKREKSPTFPFTPNLLKWSVPDPAVGEAPAEQKKEEYRRIRDRIKSCVVEFVDDVANRSARRATA
jgi:arsenate reductase (thioredoxin)